MGTLDDFINGSDSDAVDFTVADTSDPVEWNELANALGGSLVAGVASSLIALPQGYAEGVETLTTGLAMYVESVITAYYGPLVAVAGEAWDIALIDSLGFLAGPVAVGITLLAMYGFLQGIQLAVKAARGGGRL